MPPHTLHVVSHTHWDREWYLTFQQFRLRLVDLVDHVLDILESDETFRHFNLDAQTIVLEDYLQIRPHARERIERLVRAGRLGIGPWYQLNDQFLTSGEATVRSLLVGHRIARSFGACQKIGYLPDQFGNLSQMPQIFRGFGIDNAVVGRGYQLVVDRKMEFWWEGPDGSRVLGSLLAFWYNNAQRIPSEPDEAARFFERLRDKMGAVSHSRHLLLMNGVDHLEAQPDAGAIIAAHGGEPDVIHSSLPQYIDAIREGLADAPLEVKQGELREDRGGSCLAGVLSTRMYLKQANHRCQVLLEHYAERLSAFALIVGTPYPYDQLLYAWKLLMQNHPHDSICGCSVDQVHREMMTRFAQVEQVGEELTIRALNALCGRDTTCGARREETAIRVFNTLNWARTDPVIMTLEFPLGEPTRDNPPRDDSRMVRGFRILDSEGAEVPFAVTRNTAAIRQVLNPRELNLDQWVQQVDIEFIAQDVPACGYRTYSIERTDNFPAYPVVSERFETRGPNFMATPMFEDVGEVGDEYLHRKPLTDTRIRLDLRTARMGYHPSWESQNNAVRQRIVDQQQLALPESSDLDRRSDHRVECPIAVTSTIWQSVPRVEYRIDMDNRARDHRLRALWTAGAPDSVVAEGAFDAVERPVVHPLEAEGALPFHPQQSWVDASWRRKRIRYDKEGGEESVTFGAMLGIAILNKGLSEYEIYTASGSYRDNHLAVTLLRCVGYLSRRGDGPVLETPDAQCIGRHTFELATFRHDGDWKEAQVWKQAHQFNVPLRAIQCEPGDSVPMRSFVTVEPAELVVTAIKRAEDRDTLILRFYNIVDEPVEGTIRIDGASRIRVVNLDEEPQEEWTEGEVRRLTVGPKKIVTLKAEL